jgi:leucyl-tRNA synthetase
VPTSRAATSSTRDRSPAVRASGIREIVAWLEREGKGKGVAQYRLHDWCISRQRYWGPPIPIIYCDACGAVPVPEKDLPVLLPALEDFRPDDSGISPLARSASGTTSPAPRAASRRTARPTCRTPSSTRLWYHLRYLSTEFDDRPFDAARVKKWLPVATYIGRQRARGAAFVVCRASSAWCCTTRATSISMSRTGSSGPTAIIVKGRSQDVEVAGQRGGPDQYIAHWGADTFRMYLMFLGPFEEGATSATRARRSAAVPRQGLGPGGAVRAPDLMGVELRHEIVVKWHQTKKKVTASLESLSYNTAIAALMEFMNALRASNCAEREIVKDMIVMLAPFAPHFAEECWERLGAGDRRLRAQVADLGRGAHGRAQDRDPGAGERQDPRAR